MPAFRKALLIRNPTAGVNWSRALSDRVQRDLLGWLPSLEIRTTEHRDHGVQLAREAGAHGYDLVIASGGDGTLNEVINGVVGSRTAVAFLPAGTGNSMAYSLGLSLNPVKAVQSLRAGEVRPAYLGLADHRYFSLMISVGFDALAVQEVSYPLKRLLGRLSYVVAGSAALIRYAYPVITITADGRSYQGTTIVIAKSPYYASRFRIAPDTSMETPRFQICIFKGKGALNYLKYVGAVVLNRHYGLRDVESVLATEVTIKPIAGLLAQLDGEVLPSIPTTVRIARDRVNVLFPRKSF